MNFIKESNNLFVISLSSASTLDLKYLLNPSIPWIYISHHAPYINSNWRDVNLPIAPASPSSSRRIRLLTFDLEMSTKEFLQELELFSTHGIKLFQTNRQLPPHIVPQFLPIDAKNNILISAGLENIFDLPHPGEVATFSSRSLDWVENVLKIEGVQSRCISRS